MQYFTHLVGHEGKNSLLSYLKQEDLALELGSYTDHLLDCYSNFEVEITLTQKGLQNYEDVI
jgi:insulysin